MKQEYVCMPENSVHSVKLGSQTVRLSLAKGSILHILNFEAINICKALSSFHLYDCIANETRKNLTSCARSTLVKEITCQLLKIVKWVGGEH